MKQIIEKVMKNLCHDKTILASKTHPNPPLQKEGIYPLAPCGRGDKLLCAKHTITNLSTYRLNGLETDKTPTLSRICKFALSSLTNSTLSQRERVKYGFTLAEVLITLGIIGIVAALTIPNLIADYKEKRTVATLKKAYSTMSQAYLLAKNDYGDITDWEQPKADIFAKYIKNVKKCKTHCFPKKH